jgi:hypothetical protein
VKNWKFKTIPTSGLEDFQVKHPPFEKSLNEAPSSVRGSRTLGTFIFQVFTFTLDPRVEVVKTSRRTKQSLILMMKLSRKENTCQSFSFLLNNVTNNECLPRQDLRSSNTNESLFEQFHSFFTVIFNFYNFWKIQKMCAFCSTMFIPLVYLWTK